MSDLEAVINDAISDVELPPDTIETEAPEVEASSTSEDVVAEANEPATDATAEVAPVETAEVASPAAAATAAPAKQDEFEKKFGIPAQGASGRENRIPYSRVKKIVEKHGKDIEAQYAPKVKEYETKIQEYEGAFERVRNFEQVMMNDSKQFLNYLYQIPAYKQIFDDWAKKIETATAPAAPAEAAAPPADPTADMPQPDQQLSDGSMVYSLEGLKSLMAWQAKQVEDRVTKQYREELNKRDETIAPIRNEWEAHRQLQAMVPRVQAQIQEARTWPQFNENEDEIVKVLQQYPQVSLEKAYQHVVYPKLMAARDTMRAEILKEIKSVPKTTSAPVSAGRPVSPAGPRSLEDVIRDSVKGL